MTRIYIMSPPSPYYASQYQPIIVDIPEASPALFPHTYQISPQHPKRTKTKPLATQRLDRAWYGTSGGHPNQFVNPYIQQTPAVLARAQSILIHRALSSLVYDLTKSPLSAFLIPGTKALLPNTRWRELPAMSPANARPMTIRIPGIDMPVTVLPVNGTVFVTIWDVLCAVHRAVSVASVSFLRRVNAPTNYGGTWRDKGDRDIKQEELTAAIQRYFGTTRMWWVGLYRSQWEKDVWVLYTVKQEK